MNHIFDSIESFIRLFELIVDGAKSKLFGVYSKNIG